MSGLDAIKWVFIVICFAVSMGAGLAPMKLPRCRQNQKLLGILNSFSGGVFLAIAFCHILPETANLYYYTKLHKLLENQKQAAIPDVAAFGQNGIVPPVRFVTDDEIETLIQEYQSSFPLPYVLVVLGYAFILLIDRVIMDSHSVEIVANADQLDDLTTQMSVQTPHQKTIEDIEDEDSDREDALDSQFIGRSDFSRKGRSQSRSMAGSHNRPKAINDEEGDANDQIVEEIERKNELDAETKARRQRRKQEALRAQLSSYLKKQEKFAGAMKNILVEHREKVRQDRRTRNYDNYRTFTPPNNSSEANQEPDEQLFVQDPNVVIKKRQRSGSDGLSDSMQDRPLLVGDTADGPKGKELETTTEQEEFMVQEATKGICSGFNLQSLVLLTALSMHALFEGIALGLTKETSATINIMLALILHKPAAALSLGVSITKNFVEKNEEKKGIFLLTVFAAATPIGVMLGMALQHSSDIVEVVFNSMAGGTFLYIAASEVIVEEFSMPDRNKWLQYLAFLAGIALITSLWFMEQ